jgi:hypothetical protein
MIASGAFPDGVVIAVKKKSEPLVENLIVGHELFKDHLLKKPRGVCDVPSRR